RRPGGRRRLRAPVVPARRICAWLAGDVLQRRERLPVTARSDRRVVGLQAPVVVGGILARVDRREVARPAVHDVAVGVHRVYPVVVVEVRADLVPDALEEEQQLTRVADRAVLVEDVLSVLALDGRLRALGGLAGLLLVD